MQTIHGSIKKMVIFPIDTYVRLNKRWMPGGLYRIATTALLSPPDSEINKKRYSRNTQEVIDVTLTFTEEQAIEIRKTGLSVIQFKYCIKNGISIAVYNLRQFLIAAKSVFEKMGKLFKRVRDGIDDILYFFETVQDRLGYPVSRRYNFVKIIGNMGYRKHDVFVATRTYLARSNC